MTIEYLEGLPESVRDLTSARLLCLAPDERVAQLSDALCRFYDHLAGDTDEEDDFGSERVAATDHPMILESALAAELNMALDGWLGVTVPIESLLLDGLSPRRLAERLLQDLEEGTDRPGHLSLPPLVSRPEERYEPFDLSDIQQAYWIGRDPVYELGDVSASLYVELVVRDFDVERASLALDKIVARHDMLRSVVDPDGVQRVLPESEPVRIDVVDLRDLDGDARAAELATERARLAQRKTAPHRPEPFELRLLCLDDVRSCLLMSVDMVKLDAWSVQLLLAEWFVVYDNPDLLLPDVGLTFRDYVRWNDEVRSSPAYETAKQYWLERLPSLPAPPELPLSAALHRIGRPNFTARSVRIPQDQWARLKERAGEEGLTPSMVLCALYVDVLGAWSRHPRFTLSVAGGRPPAHADLPRVLGPFARPTLLEVDVSLEEGLRDRARAMQRRFARDMEQRHFGGLDVLRELAAVRGRTRAAMPVIFTSVLPQAGEGGIPRPSWLEADPYVVWGMPQLLLENQMLEVDGDLIVTWVFVDEAFDPGVVDAMFEAYRGLISRAAEDAGLWHEPAPELLPGSQAARRDEVNATSAPVPSALLHEPFAEQVARQPHAVAVICGRRRLTYADLDGQAEGVAAQLLEKGVRPGQVVAVCMERGWEQVAAVIGILRAGAAYLPLDPDLPTRRLHHLLDVADVGVTLVQAHLLDRVDWPAQGERVAVVYADEPPQERMPPRAQPDDLAYVIFTSGSTGVPKGVMIEHASALNTLLDVNRRFGIVPSDRVLALSSLSFDLSVQDIFGTLAGGASIVMPNPSPAPDVDEWWDLVEREEVTIWNSVPALLQLFVTHRRGATADPLPLRLALLSGDWIPVGLPAALRRLAPAVDVVSLGGATEVSVWSVFHPVDAADAGRRSVPYGRPLTNQQMHVLDARLRRRPEHVPGDLYISGAGLARGYWRDPERTAASFITHPTTGLRLYRTGDVARYLDDGELEFLGREDAQVKVNGYRIELGEVEAALLEHQAVEAAVASAHGDGAVGRVLLAHVVLRDADISPSELILHLQQRLPTYAVPSRVLLMDALPLTANGKVDRAALGVAVAQEAAALPTVISPAGDAFHAEVIASMLSELLDRPVGVHDDIYALGANSLVAVRLVERAREAGLRLTAADVLENPSAAGLSMVAAAVPPEEASTAHEACR